MFKQLRDHTNQISRRKMTTFLHDLMQVSDEAQRQELTQVSMVTMSVAPRIIFNILKLNSIHYTDRGANQREQPIRWNECTTSSGELLSTGQYKSKSRDPETRRHVQYVLIARAL